MTTKLPEQRQTRSWLAELSDAFTGFPAWTGLRPAFADTHLIRLEEEVRDGHYTVRAEIPGIDPAKDVEVTVRDNQLTIKAERSEKKETNGHSEFRYGSFFRNISLPSGANTDKITARYDNGILTVDIAVPKASEAAVKRIPLTAQT